MDCWFDEAPGAPPTRHAVEHPGRWLERTGTSCSQASTLDHLPPRPPPRTLTTCPHTPPPPLPHLGPNQPNRKDAKKGGFSECPERYLAWEYRLRLIIAEISQQDPLPDVIAMEEVDRFDQVHLLLRPLGYTGVFAAKASSPCQRSLDPSLKDGCALFWLKSEVRPLHASDMQVLRYAKEAGGDGVVNELTVDRSRSWEAKGVANQLALVGTFTHLTAMHSQRRADFRIAVTHLTAAKSAEIEAARADQCRQLLVFLAKPEAPEGSSRPTIVACDLNASPSRGRLTYDPEAYPAMRVAFDSAYERGLGAEPEWTTWKVSGGWMPQPHPAHDHPPPRQPANPPTQHPATPQPPTIPPPTTTRRAKASRLAKSNTPSTTSSYRRASALGESC